MSIRRVFLSHHRHLGAMISAERWTRITVASAAEYCSMKSPPLPDEELLLELCRYRMPFGKHQGQLLLRLPEAYLAWFARKGMPSGKLGMMLETALVVRQNGLDALVAPLLAQAESEAHRPR